jgi:hypothetical protein
MLYNQPYDQPTNPSAGYVDGNPKAGIEGSIVPAAAVEFDQREVVEVINAAYTRQYTDFTNTPCAAPANTDLTQLRKAIEGFIRTTPIPQWYIDNVVNYVVHGTGAKYSDLNVAFEDLSKYIITHNGKVTLALAAGRWTYGGAGVTLDHPNADRITVTGANLLSYPVPTDFTVTGYNATARANDRVNTLNRLRTHFATELDFTSGASIATSATSILFQNVLVVGDRSSAGGLGVQAGILVVNNVSMWGGYIGVGGGLLSLMNGGFLSSSGNSSHGIGLSSGGNMWHGQNTQVYVTSNDYNGIGAGFDCGANGYAQILANGNASAGLMCSIIGQYQTGSNSQFNTNAINGVFIDQASFFCDNSTGNPQFYNNAGAGLYVTVDSSGQCPGGQFSGNGGGYNVVCGAGSYVQANGSSGVLGACTPVANTLSADGSYIAV